MVSQLSELERESVDYFVSFVQVLGMPKSLGQIYGLLFVSEVPLPMDDVIGRLEISKGSVSQGIATLRNLGAVVAENKPGDRREHYVADLNVSRIVNHFFENRLEPRLEHGKARLEKMLVLADEVVEQDGENAVMNRVEALSRWQSRGNRAIPLVKKFLKS